LVFVFRSLVFAISNSNKYAFYAILLCLYLTIVRDDHDEWDAVTCTSLHWCAGLEPTTSYGGVCTSKSSGIGISNRKCELRFRVKENENQEDTFVFCFLYS
jgi:hypothetical protein